MNRKTVLALAVFASFGATPLMVFGQGVEQREAIASSDVLSQISMFSYKDGPKSDLLLRGTPIAATAQGNTRTITRRSRRRSRTYRSPRRSVLTPLTCSGG
jgi:hypothetical protein